MLLYGICKTVVYSIYVRHVLWAIQYLKENAAERFQVTPSIGSKKEISSDVLYALILIMICKGTMIDY